MVGGVVGGVEGEVWSCEGRLCGGGGGVEVPRPPGYEANPGESDEIGDRDLWFQVELQYINGVAQKSEEVINTSNLTL